MYVVATPNVHTAVYRGDVEHRDALEGHAVRQVEGLAVYEEVHVLVQIFAGLL